MENLIECRANFYEGRRPRRVKEVHLFVNKESITFKSDKDGINQKIMISDIKDLYIEKFDTTIITGPGNMYNFWVFTMKKSILGGFTERVNKNKSRALFSILSNLKSQYEAKIQKTPDKLRDMLKVSTKININILREILGVDSSTFYDNIFSIAAQIDATVDGDYLLVDNVSTPDFINALNDKLNLGLMLIKDQILSCTYCGYPLKLNEKVCNNCGTKLKPIN